MNIFFIIEWNFIKTQVLLKTMGIEKIYNLSIEEVVGQGRITSPTPTLAFPLLITFACPPLFRIPNSHL